MEIIRADGVSVYYTDSGEGVPLLFIHGWLMSHLAWALQSPLIAGFRVVTLDLRGHGNAAGADFSYNACCEDLALLIDCLSLDRVIMVGWSMGAQIALQAFPAVKEKIAAMVLVGATPHFCSSNDFPYGVAPPEARSMALRIKKDYNRTAGEFFSGMFSPTESGSLDMRLLADKVVGRLPSRDNALAALTELISNDLRAALPLISIPVMLIHGLDDKICLPGAAKFMAGKIPSAELELLSAAGHAPFMANPEGFNRMLSGFAQAVHG